MYDFCTCFDNNYLIYGITLFRSLKKTGIPFRLFVACLDDQVFENLEKMNLPEIIPVKLSEIEAYDPKFASVKNTRSVVEYYFTLSPILPLFLFHKYPDLKRIAYLDSDLFFFSSPEPFFEEAFPDQTLIIQHDFAPEQAEYADRFGIYNVAFQIYRNTNEGKLPLLWWRDQCIEWCFNKEEPERYADQKYLNQWPIRFPKITVCMQNRPSALAPWNWMNHSLTIRDHQLFSDGKPVIFYHYQDFKFVFPGIVIPGNMEFIRKMPIDVANFLHRNYYQELLKTAKMLELKIGNKNFRLIFPLKRYQKTSESQKKSAFFRPFEKICRGIKKIIVSEILFHGIRFH